MKLKQLLLFGILTLVMGLTNVNAQDFYLNANGVTCMCPTANIGDSGVVNGVTYTKRIATEITDVNASTTCTSGITDMSYLFDSHFSFNGDIGSWDVSDVINMSGMFWVATDFNQNIGSWDVSNVINMDNMFRETTSFNQYLGDWDVSNVINMEVIFYESQSINQDFSNWQFNPNVNLNYLFSKSGLDTDNYDSLLQSFVNQNLLNKEMVAEDLTYCNETPRNELLNNMGWIITEDLYLQPNLVAPINLNIEPNPTTCVATGVDLGTPSTTNGCGVGVVTNNAPTEFPIGETIVTWTLTDGNGITDTDTQLVTVTLSVDVAEVCYVTSDDVVVTNNRIFLFNIDGQNVDNYEVLRETTTGGVYETIGFIIPPANSFLDTTSNNNTQAYRYKVQTLDVCGAMSIESPYHKTILLQSSIAANQTINLSWTPYVGTDYTTYNIFKQINGGTFELFTSIASTNLTYNDIDVDIALNDYAYFVSIDVGGCVGTPFMSESIKSNQDGTLILGINDNEQLEKSIILFPNPTSSIVNIELPDDLTLNEVNIINNLGQIVAQYNSKSFNIEALSTGLYFLNINTSKGSFVKRLIKN